MLQMLTHQFIILLSPVFYSPLKTKVVYIAVDKRQSLSYKSKRIQFNRIDGGEPFHVLFGNTDGLDKWRVWHYLKMNILPKQR